MDKDTLEALKGSITKWEDIVQETGVDRGAVNCSLCELFIRRRYHNQPVCEGCPVKARTRKDFCDDTPHIRWAEHHRRAHLFEERGSCRVICTTCLSIAKEELEFLKSLLPKEMPREVFMTRQELVNKCQILDELDRGILVMKNKDYALESDALSNFRGFGFKGIVIRMNDKMSRLVGYVQHDGEVSDKDETIFDTLADLRNYARLADIVYREETRDEKTKAL